MDLHQLDQFLLVGSAVLLAAVLAVRLSVRAGLPSLLVYLGIGVILGDSLLGVQFSDADVAHALGFGALVLILAEGGLTTKWSEVRPSIGLGLLLATVGVVVSVTVVSVACHVLLGLPWETAILLGAVTSPTDAAAVFSVLRRVPLRPRVLGALEAESGLNDAPIVLLVTAVSVGTATDLPPLAFAALAAVELVVGALLGYVIGRAGAWALRGAALPSSGLYPIAVLAICVLAYATTVAIHTSGFAAVYVAALVLGNSDLPHRAASRSFAEGIGWLAQIGLFVMLGLLVSPALIDPYEVWVAIAAGAILTFVARPLSVVACGAPLRVPWREQAFVSWAGLRGAVPIVLASVPLAEGVPGAVTLFNVVFVFVVVYTFVQAPTLGRVAAALGVTEEGPRDVDVEAAPLERVAADLLQIRVPRRSRLVGVEVGELRLPAGASVALVVRDGRTSVPHRTYRLHHDDDLLVVAPREVREEVEARFRAVGRRGRLAGWLRDDP